MKKRPFRSITPLMMLICLFFSLMASPADAQMDSVIRVWLKRQQREEAVYIEIQGTYMLEDESMLFSDGSQLVIVRRGEHMVLHTDSIAVKLGSSAKLIRYQHEEKSSALRINDSAGLYEGDLYLSIQNEMIRPILHIFIENYLLGVVPYEMGDSFPLEALKAQAVAARTYAMRKSGSSGDYDLEDTTNDQAFKGRSNNSPRSEQAVYETEGLCGTYNGKLAWCYYSASNGGQTELGEHVWPTTNKEDYAYMDMRDDPYDYENSASIVKRYTIAKKPGKDGIGTALHTVLTEEINSELKAMGYAAVDENQIRYDRILSVKAVSPRFSEPSRVMTELEFIVNVSIRDYLYKDDTLTSKQRSESDASVAESVFEPTPTPAPTSTPAYSPYRKIEQDICIRLPVFTEAEQAMGLSINTKENELITVFDIGSAFMIESRRFGHGVGMSQRGAQQMAEKYGMTQEDILRFYYPGMDVTPYPMSPPLLPIADEDLRATPQPQASPTPHPTLMPVSKDNLPKGAYIAVVTNINEDSYLNLRESPSLSAEVVLSLYKNQELIVLSKHAGGWVKVKTDIVEGYVSDAYLQRAE